MIEIIGEIGRSATKEEIKHFLHEDADCGKKNCEGSCVCANAKHGQN